MNGNHSKMIGQLQEPWLAEAVQAHLNQHCPGWAQKQGETGAIVAGGAVATTIFFLLRQKADPEAPLPPTPNDVDLFVPKPAKKSLGGAPDIDNYFDPEDLILGKPRQEGKLQIIDASFAPISWCAKTGTPEVGDILESFDLGSCKAAITPDGKLRWTEDFVKFLEEGKEVCNTVASNTIARRIIKARQLGIPGPTHSQLCGLGAAHNDRITAKNWDKLTQSDKTLFNHFAAVMDQPNGHKLVIKRQRDFLHDEPTATLKKQWANGDDINAASARGLPLGIEMMAHTEPTFGRRPIISAETLALTGIQQPGPTNAKPWPTNGWIAAVVGGWTKEALATLPDSKARRAKLEEKLPPVKTNLGSEQQLTYAELAAQRGQWSEVRAMLTPEDARAIFNQQAARIIGALTEADSLTQAIDQFTVWDPKNPALTALTPKKALQICRQKGGHTIPLDHFETIANQPRYVDYPCSSRTRSLAPNILDRDDCAVLAELAANGHVPPQLRKTVLYANTNPETNRTVIQEVALILKHTAENNMEILHTYAQHTLSNVPPAAAQYDPDSAKTIAKCTAKIYPAETAAWLAHALQAHHQIVADRKVPTSTGHRQEGMVVCK